MPQPTTEVAMPRVFERMMALASGNDPRAFCTSSTIGLRVETASFGPVDLFANHLGDGVPMDYNVVGSSISVCDELPCGQLSLSGVVLGSHVPYRPESGAADAKIKFAPIQQVMSEVAKALQNSASAAS